MQANLASNPL